MRRTCLSVFDPWSPEWGTFTSSRETHSFLVLQFVTELDILVGSVTKRPATGHDWGLQKSHFEEAGYSFQESLLSQVDPKLLVAHLHCNQRVLVYLEGHKHGDDADSNSPSLGETRVECAKHGDRMLSCHSFSCISAGLSFCEGKRTPADKRRQWYP